MHLLLNSRSLVFLARRGRQRGEYLSASSSVSAVNELWLTCRSCIWC